MKVFVLGLDGATWDLLKPLAAEGRLPNLSRLMGQGASGTLRSIFPPLSPVAWTGIMTGKNSGKHGIFEFLEYSHNPLQGRVNSSRAIQTELVWEVAGRHGKSTVAGGVPMSYPARNSPGFFLGDFLSPADAPDFASDPAIFAELEAAIGPYRPWSTAVHDGGNEAGALAELTDFLDQHLRAVRFLMKRCPWDLFMFDLRATDRIQHELWHAWEPTHREAQGRDLSGIRAGYVKFWEKLDEGVGEIEAGLPPDTTLLLISDHGFGPIEWYVNFNVWLLGRGDIALQDSIYVKQKKWFYDRGVTPQWFYNADRSSTAWPSSVLGDSGASRSAASSGWRSRPSSRSGTFDWSKTEKAYSQGNFGQIFVNQKGRQPQGCVEPQDVRPLLDDLKAALLAIKHPETGEPLVDKVLEREDLYHGPHAPTSTEAST